MGECFFERDEDEVHDVGEEVEAPEIRWEVGRDESSQNVACGVVVGGREWERGRDGVVIPGCVKVSHRREESFLCKLGMHEEAVYHEGEEVTQQQASKKILDYCPRQGKRSRNFQRRLLAPDFDQTVFDQCLDRNANQ